MKRYGFSGMPASHGTSLAHRSGGSTGQRDAPGRVRYISLTVPHLCIDFKYLFTGFFMFFNS